MRKILSLVLVLSLVLGSVSMAFAAPSSVSADIEDKNVKKAVERLVAFGIVHGMDDGKYHPDQEVTREQFAKILVTALGMESAAGASSTTSFTDVAGDRWSAGFIEVAAGQGLIKGYPDGTFQPAKGVSYSEAVTMLVRALGYEDSFLKGSWPGNYIAKAADEKITSKVKFQRTTIADRGSVAVMVNNTLDAEVIEPKEFGGDTKPTFEKTGDTLLEEKLQIFELENARFLENAKLDSALDKNEVNLIFTDDTDFKGHEDEYEEDHEYEFEIVDGFDSDYYLGLETTVYVNDDDEIVYAEITDTGNTIYRNDRLDAFYDKKPEKEITLKNADEDLEVTDAARVYVNGTKIDEDEFETYLGDTDEGNDIFGAWIADDDELVYANLVTWEKKDYLVQEVQEDDETIVYLDTNGADDDEDLDLGDEYDSYELMLVQGNELVNIELSDLEEGDVFNVADVEEDDDDVASIYVWRDTAEGEMGRIKGGNNDQRMKIEIGDEEISVETDFTYSDDSGDDFYTGEGKTVESRDDLEDFQDEQVKVYKNWKGRIIYIDGDVNTTSDEMYGVVLGYESGLHKEVELYTSNDETEIYEFEESDDFKWLKEHAEVGSIIKFELNSDGEIAEYGDYDDIAFDIDDTAVIEAGDDFGSKSVRIGNKTYYVDSDTVFFDYTDHDPEEVDVFEWRDLEDRDVDKDVTVIFGADGSDLEFLAAWENLDDIKDDVVAGYVIETWQKSGDGFAEIHLYGKDEVEELELEGDIADDIDEDKLLIDGRVVLVEKTSGDKIDIVTHKDWEIKAGRVEDTDDDRITIEDVDEYAVHEDVLVYDGDDQISFSKISDDDFVVVAVEKGEVQVIELVYSETSDDEYAEGTIIDVDDFEVDPEKKYEDELEGEELRDDIADALVADGYLQEDSLKMYSIGDKVKFLYDEDTMEVKVIWAETTGEADEDVIEVENLIKDLPDPDDVDEDDEEAINEAKDAYEDLDDDQKDAVDSDLVDKLEDCIEALEDLVGPSGDITATFTSPVIGFAITVEVEGIEGAAKFVVYEDDVQVSKEAEIGSTTGMDISRVKADDTVTVKILDASGEELATKDFKVEL